MKVLVVCRAGTIRSVALAHILRVLFKYDVIPVSGEYNEYKTKRNLCEWADKIIIVQEEYKKYIPLGYDKKLVLCNIGRDKWHDPFDTELTDRIYRVLSKLKPKLEI